METKIGNVLQNSQAAMEGNGVKKKYKVTFLPVNKTVEVDESQFPLQHDGKPGSLLDIALAHGITMGHNCGGNCACTTCHIVVKQGMENLSAMEQDEEDRLDMAEGLTLSSRLGCQAVVQGDVIVEIMEEGEGGH
ncbi:MAG TPA: 2Fe-2S iron-sulfur cluster-binding protein [Nitrospiria bacterium]|nr:2Fe-2S iron-sulfur cluster-binding protein [Nitrospiria bacterium]